MLLVSPDDRGRIERRIESEFPSIETIKRCYEAVCNYLQVAIGDGAGATFSFNIHDFCRRYSIYHGTAVNVFKLLQQNGYMTLTDEMENPSRILFCVSRDDLYRIRVERNDLDQLIRTILRLYDRVFNEFRPIDEGEIAAASGYTPERVHELLKKLWQMHIIPYIPSNRSPLLYFDEERLPLEDLHIAPETYQRRKQMSLERYEGMLRYAFNDTTCRSRMLEEYFGGADAKDCGICDVCLERRRGNSTSTAASFTGTKPDGSTTTPAPDTAITSAGPHFGSNTDTQHIPAAGSPTTAPANRQQLLEEIRRHPHPDIRQVASRFACDPKTVIRMIDELLADGKISIDKSGFITINR